MAGKGVTQAETTVTVTGSRTVGRPDGRVAIPLETSEIGAIAFDDRRVSNRRAA